jgi:hypothetical protein
MAMIYEWFDLKISRTVFAGLSSKPVATVSSGLILKSTATVSNGLTSNPAVTVSDGLALKHPAAVSGGLASKSSATVFSSLASKLVATVSPCLTSKPTDGFSVEPQNQGGGWFSGLSLKTGSTGLLICASKSPRRFLGLDLKTKQASVYRLRHKTDGGRSA